MAPLLLLLAGLLAFSGDDDEGPCLGGMRMNGACRHLTITSIDEFKQWSFAFAFSRWGGEWAKDAGQLESRFLEAIWTACPACRGAVPAFVTASGETVDWPTFRTLIQQAADEYISPTAP